MDVVYKNNRRYNIAKYPIRQPKIVVFIIRLLSKLLLIGKDYKIEKRNMEGLEPPYLLLSNHMAFVDFEILALATFPHRVNSVASVDGYYRRPWLMEFIGTIGTRKFVGDLHLVKSIRRVLQRGDILCLYPEARYTPIGTRAFLPESLGKLIKMNKVPVVAVVHRGNHLHTPFWNYRKPRKVPLHTTLTQILTAEQVQSLSVAEINAIVAEALEYDEYRYQKENGILIQEPFRAEGLHKVLYQCPHCLAESQMGSEGSELFCGVCGKRWYLRPDGALEAREGETEFSHIPSWYEWERAQVRGEIEEGRYAFSDDVEVFSLPRFWRFVKLGKARLRHDPAEGFVLEGHYNGRDYRIHRRPAGMNGLHIEYDYCHLRPEDCFDISTPNNSFYCYPSKKNIVTKLAFATEELYKIEQEKRKRKT